MNSTDGLKKILSLEGLIYLGSPYSHFDKMVKQRRYIEVVRAAAFLINRGLVVFSPICHCHPIAENHELPGNWTYWEKYNKTMISKSDRLVMLTLDGWRESIGLTAEREIFLSQGKPSYELEPSWIV